MAKPPPRSAKPAASRSARLAAALRANLKRRKAQARNRSGAGNLPKESKAGD
jgi:hypothetical protein